MAPSLQDLIDFLLAEIALSGDQGMLFFHALLHMHIDISASTLQALCQCQVKLTHSRGFSTGYSQFHQYFLRQSSPGCMSKISHG